jgi:hypothetical protein
LRYFCAYGKAETFSDCDAFWPTQIWTRACVTEQRRERGPAAGQGEPLSGARAAAAAAHVDLEASVQYEGVAALELRDGHLVAGGGLREGDAAHHPVAHSEEHRLKGLDRVVVAARDGGAHPDVAHLPRSAEIGRDRARLALLDAPP